MKKIYYVLLALAVTFVTLQATAQTRVPDANFRQALIDSYGVVFDGEYATTSTISGITFLNIPNKNISDLTGIEYFTALDTLQCNNNQLTTLDISSNTKLKILACHRNNLTNLDVSKNTKLEIFFCDANALTSLDVRNGANDIIRSFVADVNPDLTCIYVDDKDAPYLLDWDKDATTHFVNNETECTTVSVTEIAEQTISIYPNPTTSIVHLNLAGKSIQNLKMVDVTGKIISEKNHVNSTETIDLSNFSNGLYLVILQSENGTQSFKVVKE